MQITRRRFVLKQGKKRTKNKHDDVVDGEITRRGEDNVIHLRPCQNHTMPESMQLDRIAYEWPVRRAEAEIKQKFRGQ